MAIQSSDQELLAAFARDGSQQAFSEIVRRHGGWVRAVCRRQLRQDEHLAEDVTQAVFLLLATRAARLARSSGSLSGWLFRTARFTAANARRREIRRARRERDVARMKQPPAAPSPDAAECDRLLEAIDAAVAHLSAKERDAIVLRYYQDKTVPQVAAALGISESAAKKRLMRAVATMRAYISRRQRLAGDELDRLLPALATAAALQHAIVWTGGSAVARQLARSCAARSAALKGALVAACILLAVSAATVIVKSSRAMPPPTPAPSVVTRAAPLPPPATVPAAAVVVSTPAGLELRGDVAPVLAVAFSPDARFAITASVNQFRVWDLTTRRAIAAGPRQGSINGAAVLRDGEIVVADGGNVRLFDPTGKPLSPRRPRTAGIEILDLVVSPDERFVAVAQNNGTIVLRDLPALAETARLQGGLSLALAFSPDGASLLAGGGDGMLRLWDLRSKTIVHTMTGHTGQVFGVAFASDGRRAVSFARGSAPTKRDLFVRVWDTQSGTQLLALENQNASVSAVAFTPDGRNVLCVEGTELVTWDAQSGAPLGRRMLLEPSIGNAMFAAFSTDRSRVILGGITRQPTVALVIATHPDSEKMSPATQP